MASTVWKGHLTFGLISIPVRMTTAARSERISFNQLHKETLPPLLEVLGRGRGQSQTVEGS